MSRLADATVRVDPATTPRRDIAAHETAFDVAEKIAHDLWETEVTVPRRRPRATYRLQLHKQFNLDAVTALVPYLDALGISDTYLSPYLMARPGSLHGYDVCDYGRVNPEIGDEASDDHCRRTLQAHGMGRVLDIVPNHMGIGGVNRYWLDVLENGPLAPSGRFFDIDWRPIKEELRNRVLLPILEDQYGRVLEKGLIRLEHEGGSFFIRYHDYHLPLAPRSYAMVLDRGGDALQRRLAADDPARMEYESIRFSAADLPGPDTTDHDRIAHLLSEKGGHQTSARQALRRSRRGARGARHCRRLLRGYDRRCPQLRRASSTP